jgi:predicted ester cyclase
VRGYFEALSTGQPDMLDQILDPGYVFHASTGDVLGVEPVKGFAVEAKTGVPDATWTVQDIGAEGDYVFVRVSVSGTQVAAFSGMPFTGGTISGVPGMGIYRIANGKIVESWSQDNLMVIGQQLGSAPAPFGPPVFTDQGGPVGPQTDKATRDANKAIVKRLVDEAFGAGNMAVVDELYAPDAVNRPTASAQGPDLQGVKTQIGLLRAGMPDMQATADLMVAEGDEVATFMTIRGTNSGSLFALPPTNKQIVVTAMRIDRLSGGKIVETWFILDSLSLFTQLGVLGSGTDTATPTS